MFYLFNIKKRENLIISPYSEVRLEEEKEVYYIGIIDFFQKFNSKKKIAGFAKSFKHTRVFLKSPFIVPIVIYISNLILYFLNLISNNYQL